MKLGEGREGIIEVGWLIISSEKNHQQFPNNVSKAVID